ncbi:hypothetical protein R1flu_023829 [Riccia fluitans]|uniref:No apical meristem-associated C-terminal domain-containing protein n=1 Tax=Riccia fluitans TaxID=41844 RepID=A0ABD1XT62_9MARC
MEKSPKRNKCMENNTSKSPAPSVDNVGDSPVLPPSPAYNTRQQAQRHHEEPKGNLKAKRKGKATLDENVMGQEKAFWDAMKAARKESIKEAADKREEMKNGAGASQKMEQEERNMKLLDSYIECMKKVFNDTVNKNDDPSVVLEEDLLNHKPPVPTKL